MAIETTPSLLFNQSFATMMEKTAVIRPIAITAPIALIVSLLIVFTIWRTKELHNKSHYVMASLAMADSMYNVQMIIGAIRLAIRIRNATPLIVPSWVCVFNSQLTTGTLHASGMLCVSLGVDRFLCVTAPIFYKQLRAKYYIVILNVVAYTWCFTIAMISMIGTDVSAMWNCEATSQQYNIIGEIIQSYYINPGIKASLIGILYTSAAVVLLYRYKRAAINVSNSQQRSEWRRRWEIRTFVSMGVIGLITVALQVPKGIPVFFTFAKNDYRLGLVVLFLTVALQVEAIIHFIVYLAIDTSFRKGFQKAFAIKKVGNGVVSSMYP